MGKGKSGSQSSAVTDDELLDQCIKANAQCHAESCSKSIHVIGLACSLCTHLFCTKHQLPEEHGCGQAVKRQAQKKSTPKVDNPQKTTDLHNKLGKKLDQMKKERQKKGK